VAVPSYSINWDSLLSSTLNNTRAEVYDAIFGSNPFFAWLHSKGRKQTISGGAKIQRTLEYAQNNTVQSLQGYDVVDLTPQEHLTTAVDEWREIAGSVVISKREENLNNGEAALVDLLQSKIRNLSKSFTEELARQVLAPSGATFPASGNSSKDLNSLPLIINPSTGTVHGISDATYTWWANTTATASSSSTWAGLRSDLRHQYNLAGKHNEGFPDLVLTDLEGWEAYVEAMESQLRYGSTQMADIGFRTVSLEGAQLMWDRRTPGSLSGTVCNYDTANESNYYFINSDYMNLIVHSDADMVNMPFIQSQNQLARSAIVYFMGNLICTNRRTQTLLYSVSRSISS
jgi:hypothetical protein